MRQFLALCLLLALAGESLAQGTTITYQGQLKQSGTPYTGLADMEFRLFDSLSGGSTVGSPVSRPGVPVEDGLFQVELDFTVFDFEAAGSRYLEVRVGGTPLIPRQRVTAAPVAAYALWSPAGSGPVWESVSGGIQYNDGRVRVGQTAFGTVKFDVVNSDIGLHALRGRTLHDDGWGVLGQSLASTNDARGVSAQATGGAGQTKALYASVNSPDGYAVYALGPEESRNYFQRRVGIGRAIPTSMLNVRTDTDDYFSAVSIENTDTSDIGFKTGLTVSTSGQNKRAVWAISNGSQAVFGQNDLSGARGVVGQASGTGSYGVFANGNLGASGTKTFQIDHPLDPANKYLVHFAAEGPEPYNVYTGTAVLDATGRATVTLPAYFDRINRDFRYQLTPIGAPAPGLHIATEIHGNRFSVAGGEPGMKVSWSVTATRDDPGVRANPMPVELAKPAHERGRYLHPEAYGAGRDRAMFHTTRTPEGAE